MRWWKFTKQEQESMTSSQGLVCLYDRIRWAAQHAPLAMVGEKKGWLTRKLFPLLTALLVVGITIGIFFCQGKVTEFGDYGYFGAFLANLVSNATVFFPVPGGLILLALGAVLSPLLVGLAGGMGAAIGELTSYILGYSGKDIVKNNKAYDKSVEWLKKWGVIAVFVFTVTPLPLDLIGIAAGVLRFPVRKFFSCLLVWKKFVIYSYGTGWCLGMENCAALPRLELVPSRLCWMRVRS
jgi:membrane protein YqaA with SNARE-associated domain